MPNTNHNALYIRSLAFECCNIALVIILYCRKDDACGEIKSCARYLSVVNPEKANAEGLVKSLGECMKRVGIENVYARGEVLKGQPIVVGGGSDGASVNIAQHNGIKGEMKRALPWVFWSWCYAHRLELACKNSDLFKNIEEILLRVYYL